MKPLILLVFVMQAAVSFSQNTLQSEIGLGYQFQNKLRLNDQNIGSYGALGIRAGINYLIDIKSGVFMETGLYAKISRGTLNTEELETVYSSLRGQAVLYMGYRTKGQWSFNLGAGMETNKDIDELDNNLEHNVRYDLLAKVAYRLKNNFQVSLVANRALSSLPDFYYVSSPKNGVYLGVVYTFIGGKPKDLQ